jgi:outer membrane receptor protein involved in Fe transport
MDNLFQKLMLGGSTAALVAAMPVGAFAQDNAAGDIEQVVVSASRVQIAGYQQPTPVTVVGAAQLEKDAYANIQDAVRQLPQVQSPPASFGASQGAGSPGTAGLNVINLRNLGSNRTLILFDSQRVVVSNLSGGVDVTTLPSAVVQRVDIVTGGASAAWGSDAVAGVVNFVLNKNFTGWKTSVEASDTHDGLNRGFNVNSAWGGDMFDGRGHLVVAGTVNIRPDTTLMVNENWFRGAYWVSNPAFPANPSAPQLIVANDVGLAGGNQGGIITTSAAVTAANSPSGQATAANVLRGIEFVGAGIPQLVNFGNVSLGVLSNGGSLTAADSDMPFQTISGMSNTYTFFGYGRYKITDTIQASLQLNYGYFTGKGTAQSFQQLNTNGVVIKSDNAFIPASVKATLTSTGITSFQVGTINSNNYPSYGVTGENYNTLAAQSIAPAVTFNRRQLERGVFTLEGTLGENWSWNTYYQHGQVRFWVRVGGGNAIEANLENAYDAVTVTTVNRGTSGLPLGSIACRSSLTGTPFVFNGVTAQSGCIPANIFGQGVLSPNTVRYITGGMNFDRENEILTQDVAEGTMQGTLPWQLPAGPVAVAFGVGYRKEAGQNFGATQFGVQAAYATANYTNFPSSSYNVMEGFAEIDAPLLKNDIVNSLDIALAGRMTSYSTSGLVETWKIGLTSQVTDDFKLRALTSVDIRAPQIQDLFIPTSVNTGSSKDPKTNSTVTLITNVTGNPNLNPEIARTYSGGIVLTPTFIDGFSMSADWFSINISGEITTVAANVILNQCNPSLPSNIYPGQLGNPNDPLCTHLVFNGANGALSNLNNSPSNIASQSVSGLDIQANYTMDFWEGNIAWTAYANLQDQNTLKNPGNPTNDSAGTGGTPKWKGLLSADYTTGPTSFTVQTRWYGSSKFTNTANTGNLSSASLANLYDPAHFEVPFTAYLDFRASYKWNDNIQIYGAIDNATNAPPPLVPPGSGQIQSNGTDIATNTTTYDLLGRAFRLGVRFNY